MINCRPGKRFFFDSIMHFDRVPLNKFVQFIRIDWNDTVDHFAHIADGFDGGYIVLGIASVTWAALVVKPWASTTSSASTWSVAALHDGSRWRTSTARSRWDWRRRASDSYRQPCTRRITRIRSATRTVGSPGATSHRPALVFGQFTACWSCRRLQRKQSGKKRAIMGGTLIPIRVILSSFNHLSTSKYEYAAQSDDSVGTWIARGRR